MPFDEDDLMAELEQAVADLKAFASAFTLPEGDVTETDLTGVVAATVTPGLAVRSIVVQPTWENVVEAGRLAACGQRNVEQARGAFGVLVEQLVEIAHAEEQQLVFMLRLVAQPLLHHRGMGRQLRGARRDRHAWAIRRKVPPFDAAR